VCENERARQPKDAPKRCAQGRMVIPGVARTISMCALRRSFPVCEYFTCQCAFQHVRRLIGYWILSEGDRL